LTSKLPSIRSGHVGLSGPFGWYFFIRLVILWGWRNTWQKMLKECLAESCPHFVCKSAKIAFQETLARLFHKSFCQSLYRSLMAIPCKSVSEECRSTVLLNIASETCATEVSYKGVFPARSSRVSCSLQESHTGVIRIRACVSQESVQNRE
jgi:hypothetical protein